MDSSHMSNHCGCLPVHVRACLRTRTGRRRQAVPLRPVARESGSRDTSEWFWNLYLKVFVTGIISRQRLFDLVHLGGEDEVILGKTVDLMGPHLYINLAVG